MFYISIIIPIKPGLESKAAAHLAGLGWSSEQYEVLLAEGKYPSRQRNLAVQQARGEIVYFLDDDSLVVADALRRLKRHFEDPSLIAVGGPSLTPASDSILQRAIGALLSSLIGAGGVRNRYRAVGVARETIERELILCNLAIKRDSFLAFGGLDERLYPNEENELMDRFVKSGGKLLYDPELVVFRSQRSTVAAFARQMFRYGRGRAEQTRIAGFRGIMPFAPLFFLFYLLTLLFVKNIFWYMPLALYILAILFSSITAATAKKTPAFLLILPPLFPLLHISNGIGLFVGFLFPLKRQSCYNHQPVTIRLLKPR